MASLMIREGPNKGQEIPLEQDQMVIGRGRDCHVVLDDLRASRRHAQILRIEGEFYIEDLGSMTGTFVNDKRISERTLLKAQDELRIGATLFIFQVDSGISECASIWGSTEHESQSASPPHAPSIPPPIQRRDPGGAASPEFMRELVTKQPHQRVTQSENPEQRVAEDRVECTVFAPPVAPAGDSFLVQVFGHTPEQAETASQLAREFDEQAQRRGFKSLEVAIARGSKLTFHLVMPGLHVEDPIQHLAWQGRPEAVAFAVSVPGERGTGTVIGTIAISQESLPLGHIKFKLTVMAADLKSNLTESQKNILTESKPAGDAAQRYRKAFISYASPDRDEVLKRVQMLKQVGIDYFQDVLSLEPGSRWEQQLYRHIDDSDLFLLFWSQAARQSKWVLEEVRYALQRKGKDDLTPPEIKPVVLEGPPPPPPPEELAHLHFNDYFIYFLAKR